MTRPTHTNIASWEASWDAAVDANFDLIFLTPFPVAQYAGSGAFPAAADYDGCILHDSNNTGDLYVSNGTSWVQIPHKVTDAIADLTDNSGGSSGGDTIAAVTDISSAADAVATLAAKLNDVLAKLRSADVITT